MKYASDPTLLFEALRDFYKAETGLDFPVGNFHYVENVSGNGVGFSSGEAYKDEAGFSFDQETLSARQLAFSKLEALASGTDSLYILEECLASCRKKILSHSLNLLN